MTDISVIEKLSIAPNTSSRVIPLHECQDPEDDGARWAGEASRWSIFIEILAFKGLNPVNQISNFLLEFFEKSNFPQ